MSKPGLDVGKTSATRQPSIIAYSSSSDTYSSSTVKYGGYAGAPDMGPNLDSIVPKIQIDGNSDIKPAIEKVYI